MGIITKIKKKILHSSAAAVMAAAIVWSFAPSALAAELPTELIPMGVAVGINLESDGVLVVGVPKTLKDKTTPSPAALTGIVPGDLIIQIGRARIVTGDDLKTAVKKLDGSPVEVTVLRGGQRRNVKITPAKTADGYYELGIWMRDGISGIGTITYYDPQSKSFGALGHSVNDTETGILFPLHSGRIIRSTVVDVIKGRVGAPGQLQGAFENAGTLGDLRLNSESGVYGTITDRKLTEGKAAIPICAEADLKPGPATILSNVSGTEVTEYTIEITRVYTGAEAIGGRCMMIQVTDPALIEKTGGIVQGMSGSPILQDGKLVGAVTHVLVNDPLRGYGISIEDMLSTADSTKLLNAA